MEYATGGSETLAEALVMDEMLVVLSRVIYEHPEYEELPMSIGALGRIITRAMRELVDESDEQPVFNAVDLPVVESASSMAVQKALGSLRTIGVLEGGKSHLEIVQVKVDDYAEELSMFFNEEQHKALASFSTRLGKNLESVLLELQEA